MDPFGNVDTSFSGPVTVALASGSGGTLNGTLTVTATDGVATSPTSSDTTSGSDLARRHQRHPLDRQHGCYHGHCQPGGGQQAGRSRRNRRRRRRRDSRSPTSRSIYEEDQYGNLVTGDNTTVVTAILASGAGRSRARPPPPSPAAWPRSPTWTTTTAETITLEFTGGDLTSSPDVPIVVSPAAASKLVIQTQPSSTATAGQPFADPARHLHEEDQYGNIETGDNSTRGHGVAGQRHRAAPGTTSVTAVGGVATFTGLGDNTAETITLTFSGGGLTAGPSNPIVVSPAAASQLVIQTQPSPTATAGQAFADSARHLRRGPVRQPGDGRQQHA